VREWSRSPSPERPISATHTGEARRGLVTLKISEARRQGVKSRVASTSFRGSKTENTPRVPPSCAGSRSSLGGAVRPRCSRERSSGHFKAAVRSWHRRRSRSRKSRLCFEFVERCRGRRDFRQRGPLPRARGRRSPTYRFSALALVLRNHRGEIPTKRREGSRRHPAFCSTRTARESCRWLRVPRVTDPERLVNSGSQRKSGDCSRSSPLDSATD